MPPRKSNLDVAMAGPAATIPPELLLDVMEDAANPPADYKGKFNYRTRTLCMLSRVNKRWHTTSKVPLYRRLFFINKPEQVAKLRRTLVKSSELAAMVAELSIQVVGERSLPTAPAAIRKAVARRQKAGKDLWDVLETLTGLHNLKVWRYEDLPISYVQKLGGETPFPNLSTVKRFETSWSSSQIVATLLKSMTSLEIYSVFAITSLYTSVFAIHVPLTFLSYTVQRGQYGTSESWNDWLALVDFSKDTLRTLELDDVDDIPAATLAAGLALVGPSLRRLFYSSRNADLEAVVAAALSSCGSLVSLRTSLSHSSPHYKLLEVLPPTIVELGLSHQSHYSQTVDVDHAVFHAVLDNAKKLPRLKVLWLLHEWNLPDGHMFQEMAGEMTSKRVEWTLVSCACFLPRYGGVAEMDYLPQLREVQELQGYIGR